MARVYVEARTRALLAGTGLGESLRYLADVRLDARGKLPRLKKQPVLLFARSVPGRPGELQLVAPDAQLSWSQTLEDRARALLTELVAPGAAPRVQAVREAMHIPGNLIGEGETQIFMTTASGAPVSITVIRRPGAPPVWGVSLSEIVDQAAAPPARETLTWYRLACFLPDALGEASIPYDPALVQCGEIGSPDGETQVLWTAIDRMLNLALPPTVFCCGNDRQALKVYGILRSRGLAVPDDISVAGFDNITFSQYTNPVLTTVNIPRRRIGEMVAEALMGNGDYPAGREIFLEPELVVRDSTGPAPCP